MGGIGGTKCAESFAINFKAIQWLTEERSAMRWGRVQCHLDFRFLKNKRRARVRSAVETRLGCYCWRGNNQTWDDFCWRLALSALMKFCIKSSAHNCRLLVWVSGYKEHGYCQPPCVLPVWFPFPELNAEKEDVRWLCDQTKNQQSSEHRATGLSLMAQR